MTEYQIFTVHPNGVKFTYLVGSKYFFAFGRWIKLPSSKEPGVLIEYPDGLGGLFLMNGL